MIEHRICSIKGIKAEKEAKKRQEAALGQQLAKLTIEQAKKELAKEFNPAPLIKELEQSQEDLKMGQDEIMVTLTELFEKVVARDGVEGNENLEEPTESEENNA